MRQDTQIMGREPNKQNVQGSRIQQEKRKIVSSSPIMSKKFRADSCGKGECNPELIEREKQVGGLLNSFESHSRDHKVLSTSELAANNLTLHKNPKLPELKQTEFSRNKREVADLAVNGPGQSASELVAKRALLFKERGRSYLAHKRPKIHQYPNNVTSKQDDLMKANQPNFTVGILKTSESAGDDSVTERSMSKILQSRSKEGSGNTAEKEKHFTTSEVAAQCGKMKSQSAHLSTSEVASGNTCRPNVHLSTSEVAAKKRRIEKRLKLQSKDSLKPLQHLSTSEVAAKRKSVAPGAGKNLQRSTSEVPAHHDNEGERLRIRNKHSKKRNQHLDEHGQKRHEMVAREEMKLREAEEEERRREEDDMRERRRIEMRREEERLEERLREKKREERLIEERIRDKKRAEEKRLEEEMIAERIREKKREEKMIEERIREKRREERKAAARLIEPRSTSEVAAKVVLSRATAVVEMLSEEEEDIVVERVEKAAPSQLFPVLEPHHKKHQREISPPKFYNKLDSDSESGNEENDDGEEDEVIAIREDLRNPPKRSTSEMFVENLKKLKTSQRQWFEAPHQKTSDNLFEQLLERNKKVEKKKNIDGSKKVKERVDEFLESCQRILPDADFPAVFKKISKYMSSISKVSPV